MIIHHTVGIDSKDFQQHLLMAYSADGDGLLVELMGL
jgi:hypothetical protein